MVSRVRFWCPRSIRLTALWLVPSSSASWAWTQVHCPAWRGRPARRRDPRAVRTADRLTHHSQLGGERQVRRQLRLADLHDQRAAGGQPVARAGEDPAVDVEAVRSAVEGEQRLVLARLAGQQRELSGGDVRRVDAQDVDATAQRAGQGVVQVTGGDRGPPAQVRARAGDGRRVQVGGVHPGDGDAAQHQGGHRADAAAQVDDHGRATRRCTGGDPRGNLCGRLSGDAGQQRGPSARHEDAGRDGEVQPGPADAARPRARAARRRPAAREPLEVGGVGGRGDEGGGLLLGEHAARRAQPVHESGGRRLGRGRRAARIGVHARECCPIATRRPFSDVGGWWHCDPRHRPGTLLATATAPGTAAAPAAAPAPAKHSAASAGSSYVPPPIAWGTCTSASLRAAGAECGKIVVPLDYSNINGAKIKVAVSRIKHKTPDAQAQGIMLVNPGGPGGSGLTLSRLQGAIPNGGGNPYDWIGFDPRGVGSSEPSLACDPNYFPFNRPDYVPFDKADETFWKKKSATYSRDCKQAGGKLLDHLKTTDTVNDIESIRKALGQQKISWYGFSYGTTIGQTYATLHPNRVHRMVLDGVTNPARDVYQSNLDQDVAFEKTENIFFAWMAKYDSVYHLGTTQKAVRKVWDQMLAKSRQKAFDGKIGPDEWTDAFLSAGYYVYGWEDTADAFVEAVKGNYAPIEQAYLDANGAPGPGSDNGFAIYLGTQCTDAPWPSSYPRIRRDNFRVYAKAPFETWANAWFNGPCLTWKGKAAKAPFNVDGSKVPPILLISETFDAATPYAGAIEVRKRFPKSVLIEGVNGSTHAGSLSGVSCTDDRIAAYLLNGTLDKRVRGNQSDVKCDPVPQPVPAGAAASSLAAQRRVAAAPSAMPTDLRQAVTSAQR
ncbi:hypothetical protein LUZ63_020575 [Rhynchospora breviuscula]|uniref:AB hydrolase-1 domain-containing protein n=1 Tax=Rhynchospora breviuscula TaxID=2022672 RepID=A0A9P9Z9W5_9POAL|nr:hypothetical protein LUZ63_020575 [Rhynchospora breviuscula]